VCCVSKVAILVKNIADERNVAILKKLILNIIYLIYNRLFKNNLLYIFTPVVHFPSWKHFKTKLNMFIA